MNYVRTFEQCNVNDVNLVGGKGANLGEMTRAKLPVPPGFSLTADAYRAFIRAADAQSTIARALAGLSIDDTLRVEKQTQIIRDFLIAQEMPRDIAAQALASYRALAKELGGRASAIIPVAVRSSATAEDLPTASFAGQQDTYLNIRGDAELLAHVKQCWASLWTARAVTYRVKQKFDHDLVALAVVVQAMIDSEVAGILFTANPVNGNRDQVVINASWGLGEAIVSGMVNPDTVTLDKRDGKILSRAIGAKEREIKYAPNGGTVELEIESARRNLPALNDAQLFELARVSERIEAHYKMPMDIEWAFANGKFFILQARPITTLRSAQGRLFAQKGEYNRTMFIEIFPDPLSPIFLSVIAPLFHSMLDFTFQTLGFKSARAIPAIGVFHHQPYFHREYIAGALRPLSAPVRERLVAQIVNPFGHQARGMHGEFSRAYLGLVIRLIRFMTAFPKKLPGLIAEYRARINAVNALELQGLRDAEIVAQVRALTLRDASRLLNYDFLMIALIGITYQMLGTLLEKYFPADNEEVRAKLISGVTGNVTMETNKRMWDLAQIVKQSRALSALVRQSDFGAGRQLAQSEEGRAFLRELDRFLAEFGHREIRTDIIYPTWGEDPAPVLSFIRGYLDANENSSPHRQQARLVQQREELARTVQARLRRDLRGRWLIAPLFNWVLRHTQTHTRERDTMHFELTRLFPSFRRLLKELGARWSARGEIEQWDDVFYFSLDELAHAADQPRDLRALARTRRAEFQASQKQIAPGIIRDGVAVDDAPAPTENVAGQFTGIAGSPGKITGSARVVRGPNDFAKLQTGEILIAPITNPVWTPLFAIAGGLVVEVGGILSHGAIVAREYGIPAVMSVRGATQIIRDGQRVTVDGNRGVVVIEN